MRFKLPFLAMLDNALAKAFGENAPPVAQQAQARTVKAALPDETFDAIMRTKPVVETGDVQQFPGVSISLSDFSPTPMDKMQASPGLTEMSGFIFPAKI